jgi:UDP-3-O-[3-hydroxymyristoyl] N-acetylglucosamine deacetylase
MTSSFKNGVPDRIHAPARASRFYQRTLKEVISCAGVGLHSGKKVAMTLCPADPDTGIIFRRTDLPNGPVSIPALWDRVVDTQLCTVLGNEDGVTVGTVEHLMAAIAGAGVDNVIIELNGPEVPIMDGSAAPFQFLLDCTGLIEQDAPRMAIKVLKPVSVGDDERSASLAPADSFSASFQIDFENPLIGRQKFFFDAVDGAFQREIARARTFGFASDVAQLQAMGLAKGGSLENAVVLTGDRVLNEDGLRFEDEFVRHKVLDSVGDLYLAGGPLLAQFHGMRSGHGLNNDLLKELFADSSAWRRVPMTAPTESAAPAYEEQRERRVAVPA